MNDRPRQPGETNRVVLVDDHPVVRAGLACFLATEDGLEVAGQAGSVADGVALVNDLTPDLVITDLSLPDGTGIDLIRELVEIGHDRVPKLVLSMHDESVHAPRALRAGASGYLMKESASDVLIDVVWALLRGETYVSPEVAQQFQSMNGDASNHNRELSYLADLLDATAYEIFHKLGQGKTIMGIADELGHSVQEVEQQLESIRQQLRLEDHSVVVREAVQWVASQQAHDVWSFLKTLGDGAPASRLTQPEDKRGDG